MATSWPTWDCHRSARVTYRLVGGRGERYPEWLQRLRGSSGVYISGELGELLGIVHGHSVVHATRQAAETYIDAFRDKADDRTIGIAVDAYLDHLRSQGRRPGTVTTARYRLHGLLRIDEHDRHLHMLTPRHARELLARRRGEAAVDTLRWPRG